MTIKIRLPSEDVDPLLLSSILADPRQRRILSILLEQSHQLTARDLAVQLAARKGEKPTADVDEEDIQRLLMGLHHRYLPKLESAGWIERHPRGIVTTQQIPFENTNSSLSSLRNSEHRWDVLTALLARPRRQYIMSILACEDQSYTLEGLATELMAHEQSPWAVDENEEGLPLSVILHHVDLPRLDEIGLIEYDHGEKTITRELDLAATVELVDIDDMDEGGFDADSRP